jgi:hypothetical protein
MTNMPCVKSCGKKRRQHDRHKPQNFNNGKQFKNLVTADDKFFKEE